MLEEQKLITVSPGKESRVTEIDPETVKQSYELLSVLEPIAVKYAMPHLTPEAFDILTQSTEDLREAIRSGSAPKGRSNRENRSDKKEFGESSVIMKRKTTKEILAESFIELSAGKPINKITIAAIADNCSMTSTTFYRHFKDKYDLIAWIYVEMARNNLNKIGHNGYLWKDTLLDGLKYYEQNRKYMVNALKHTSGRDSFINQMTKMNIGFISDEIKKKREDNSVPPDLLPMIKIYCYGTGQYLCEWLMDDKSDSCEEVATAMEACIPEELRQYLCR